MSVVDFRISAAERTADEGYPSSGDAGCRGPADRPLGGAGTGPIKGIRTVVGNWVRVEHRVTALAAWSGRVAVGCEEGGEVLLFGHVPPPGRVAVGTAGDGRHRLYDATVKPVAVLTHRARSAGRLRGRRATSVHVLQVNRHGMLAVLHGLPDDELRDVAFWDLRRLKPRRIPARGLQAERLVFVRDSVDQFVIHDGREISRRSTRRPLTPTIVYRGFEGHVSDIAVSRDGRRVAALGGETLRVWDADGALLLTAPVAGAETARGVAFNDDGSWVLASAPGLGLVAYPVPGDVDARAVRTGRAVPAGAAPRIGPPEPMVIPVADQSGPYTPQWWALVHPGILWIQRPHGIQVRHLSEPGRLQFSMIEPLAAPDVPPAYDPADGRLAVVDSDRHYVKIERLDFL